MGSTTEVSQITVGEDQRYTARWVKISGYKRTTWQGLLASPWHPCVVCLPIYILFICMVKVGKDAKHGFYGKGCFFMVDIQKHTVEIPSS